MMAEKAFFCPFVVNDINMHDLAHSIEVLKGDGLQHLHQS